MNKEVVRKIKLIQLFTLIGSSAFLVFGIQNFVSNQQVLGVFEIIFAAVAFCNITVLHFTHNTRLASAIVLGVMFLTIPLFLIEGGILNTGYLWFYTIPPLIFFLLERKIASKVLGFFFLFLLAIFTLQALTIIQTAVSTIVLRQLILSLLAMSGIVFSFTDMNESRITEVEKKAAALNKREAELTAALEKNKTVRSDLEESKQALEENRLAMVNLVEDFSEEKQLSEIQAQELQKFQLAVSAASDQIVITDVDGTALYANPITEKITGFSREEILGKKAGKLWGGLMKPEFYAQMWHTIKDEQKTFVGEIKNKRKNGEIYQALIKISPVLNKKNEVLFFVAIERDITKEKELEKLKDEFLSVASHELRTPLTAIDGLVAMIREGEYGPVNSELQQPLEDINTASERLINLVNDLLSVSRIQAGRLKFTLSEFDIAPVIKHTVELLAVVAKKKGLTLHLQNIKSITVQADQDKVTQLLNNIIGNSLKFTDKGSITISLKKGDELLTVLVTDTGIGIRQEDQAKLFARFQQLDSGKGRPAGTGLGLFISKQLCQKMGGDLTLVSSQFGKGSTFAFSVPLAKSKTAKLVTKRIAKEVEEHPDQKSDQIEKTKT